MKACKVCWEVYICMLTVRSSAFGVAAYSVDFSPASPGIGGEIFVGPFITVGSALTFLGHFYNASLVSWVIHILSLAEALCSIQRQRYSFSIDQRQSLPACISCTLKYEVVV